MLELQQTQMPHQGLSQTSPGGMAAVARLVTIPQLTMPVGSRATAAHQPCMLACQGTGTAIYSPCTGH